MTTTPPFRYGKKSPSKTDAADQKRRELERENEHRYYEEVDPSREWILSGGVHKRPIRYDE